MAKKKKKRIASKPAQSASLPEVAGTPATRSRAVSAVASGAHASGGTVANERFAYAGSDLRRIGLLAVACIGVELIAWYLLNHTGAGPQIYNLIHI